MTTDCLWELQKAVFAALDGDGVLSGLVSGVYSHVPQDTAFPYVKIDGISGQDLSALGKRGVRANVSLSVFSRERGSKEVLDIMIEIKRVLDRSSLSMTGCTMDSMNFESSGARQLGDGITWLGNIRFDVFVSQG